MPRSIDGATYKRYLGMLGNKNVQKWLGTLRFAEGTDKHDNPYGTAFSGVQFDNNGPHPEKVYGSKSGYRSSAHGAYQAMPATWNEAWGKNQTMSQQNQDIFAIHKMMQRGVDPTQGFTQKASNALAPEWASFPKYNGLSFHGQPVKGFKELEGVFNSFEPPKAPSSELIGPPAPVIQQQPPPHVGATPLSIGS